MALLYGSVARGGAGAESDIDLLVVGEVSFEEVVEIVARAQDSLRREINPLVMSLEEYRSRLFKGDHLLDTILKSPYMPVIGDARKLGRKTEVDKNIHPRGE
jgi:predicted nucleotidyltransferase